MDSWIVRYHAKIYQVALTMFYVKKDATKNAAAVDISAEQNVALKLITFVFWYVENFCRVGHIDAMTNATGVTVGHARMFLLMNCHVTVEPKLLCRRFNVGPSLRHVTILAPETINVAIQSGIHVTVTHNVLLVLN